MSPNKKPPKFRSITDDGDYLHALDEKGRLWRCRSRESMFSKDVSPPPYEWEEIKIVFFKKKGKRRK